MTWRGALTGAVLVLIVLVVVRAVFFLPADSQPVIDLDQPFYSVYFASPEGDYLIPEFRQGEASIEQLLTDLLAGPRLPNLVAVIPHDTQILGYSQTDGILYVNFSHHLVTNHPGGSRGEILTVYGIVNTLVGSEGVEEVQILVANRRMGTLAGHVDVSEPLKKDYTILGGSTL